LDLTERGCITNLLFNLLPFLTSYCLFSERSQGR